MLQAAINQLLTQRQLRFDLKGHVTCKRYVKDSQYTRLQFIACSENLETQQTQFHALTRKKMLRMIKASMVILPQTLTCGRDMAAASARICVDLNLTDTPVEQTKCKVVLNSKPDTKLNSLIISLTCDLHALI